MSRSVINLTMTSTRRLSTATISRTIPKEGAIIPAVKSPQCYHVRTLKYSRTQAVSFPAIMTRQHKMPTDKNEVVFSKNIVFRKADENTPKKEATVVLLGWGNGSIKHLQKHSALFESRGYNAMLLRTHLVEVALLPETRGKALVIKMLTHLKKNLPNEKNNPAIIYSFSATGGILFFFLSAILRHTSSPLHGLLDIKGVIFDSGPIAPDDTAQAAIRAFSKICKNPMLQKIASACFLTVCNWILKFQKSAQIYKREMLHSPWDCPQLYLYSTQDTISNSDFIRHLADHYSQVNGNVREKCWNDSKHCAHFQTHPEEYDEEIDKFLREFKIN